jgi:phosphatidylcholine synthase
VRSRVLAWGVHLFTGLGLVCAAGMAVLIVDGKYQGAFLLMLAATLIDALDGTLARAAKVAKVLPDFDGRRLDDIIDFQTYTSLPLFLLWRTQSIPGEWLLFPLLASAYGFCRKQAKTDDGYFLGFPSHWNVVAFYCFYLQPGWVGVVTVTVLALLTFVPTRYLYPSQPGALNRLTVALAIPWVVMVVMVCFDHQEWVWPSLYFPVFYMGASWWVTLRRRASITLGP